MHYAEYKHTDPALVRALVEIFPFAAISVNGAAGPRIAHAPLTFRNGKFPAGALEFHLAKANPIAHDMIIGAPITVLVQGPGAAISPRPQTHKLGFGRGMFLIQCGFDLEASHDPTSF